VGPGRLSVEIARQAAEAGFPALRFDFSEIGDSLPRAPPLDATASGIADAREAMDHLSAACGARRFVLLGLCSGAWHAHHIAVADPRVAGAVVLDGYAFPTRRSRGMELLERLDDPLAVLGGAGRRVRRLFHSEPAPEAGGGERDKFFPGDPTREQMARDLQALAARDVGLLYVYSGEWRKYRYEGQLRDAFREVALDRILTERLIATADHLYCTQPERAALWPVIGAWLRERYG